MILPVDQADRDRARFSIADNTVVEAGAGTGKTTLLAERLLAVVIAGGPDRRGIPVENIAALTFTEKAAGELKDRVAQQLEDLLAVVAGGGAAEGLETGRRERAARWLAQMRERFAKTDEDVRLAAETALASLDRAMIGTLHQFAARLLRLYPLQASVDPGFVIDEGDRIEGLFEAEWARWLDEELGEAAPRRAAWLEVLAAARLEDLRALALALADPRVGPGRLHGGPEALVRAEALAKAAEDAVKDKPETTAGKVFVQAEGLAAALRRFKEPAPGSVPARLSKFDVGAIAWPKPWEGEAGEEDLAAAKDVARATPESDLLLKRAAVLLEPFVDAFKRACARRGWIGFDGLLVAARNLVRDDLAARRALGREFRAILVDEFQDTDPLQGETVLYLAEKEGGAAKHWKDLEFRPGSLFVVGDPKQSIYQFRGADIRAYEAFTRLLKKDGAAPCILSCNFRSAPAILDTVNTLFGSLMREEAGLQPPFQSLSPAPGASGGSVELRLCEHPEGAALDSDASIAAEALETVRWVAANCGPAETGKPYRYKDVAVLLRTTAPLRGFVEAFKAAGLPHVVEAERFFFETQEVTDFLNLLRVLDDTGDRISLAGLLRSPLTAVEDRDLVLLAPRLDYLDDRLPAGLGPEAAARILSFYRTLRELREKVGRVPLQELVADVLSKTSLLEVGAAAYYSDQTVANLQKFSRMAASRGEAEGHTLKEYLAAIEKERSDDKAREGESPLADDRFDAVRLLTMHKAKGLEWPVVFLPGLTSPPAAGGREPDALLWDGDAGRAGLCLPKDRTRDLGFALFELSRKRREERERVRLLYVAMTRAKKALFLTGPAKPASAIRSNSLAGLLIQAGYWPGKEAEGSAALVRFKSDAPAPEPVAAAAVPLKADWRALGAVWPGRDEGRARAAAARVFVSPASKAEAPAKRAPAQEGSPARDRAALIGKCCHLVLERWDFKKGGDLDAAVGAAARVLAAEELSAPWKEAAAEAREILGTFLESPAGKALAKAEIVGRELPILFAKPFDSAQGAQVVRGAIDLLYKEGGKLVLADYKTEKVDKKGALEAAKRFAPQAALYAEAVERALDSRPQIRIIFLRSGVSVNL